MSASIISKQAVEKAMINKNTIDRIIHMDKKLNGQLAMIDRKYYKLASAMKGAGKASNNRRKIIYSSNMSIIYI